MQAFYTGHFLLPLPDGHRFPMEKYALLRDAVAADVSLCEPAVATDDELLLAHTPDYLARVVTGTLERMDVRRLGFPWSPQLVERSRRSVGGTLAACRAALASGAGANLAGGTHHAFADRPEGFCVFNDSVVALRVLQREGLIARALIVDLDVHQGNGTAALVHGDDRIYAFSVHGEHNFPFHKEQSDLDVGLPDGTGDERYLEALSSSLPRALQESSPDLVIYLAGADPYYDDRLGRLALSMDGLRARDSLVLKLCAGLPLALTMGGGYARDVRDTAAIHATTVRLLAARSP